MTNGGTRYRWLLVILVASMLLNGYLAFRLDRYQDADLARRAKRTDRVAARNELFKGLPMDSTSIVLFGDSHFEQFPATEYLGLPNIKNRGLSGQDAADLVERVDDLVNTAPGIVVLCIGSNDVNNGRSLAAYEADVSTLLDRFAEGSPRTRILVLAIPPNSDPAAHLRVEQFNTALERLCATRGLPFIALPTALIKDGALDPACTYDGLHLNAKGYRFFAEALRSHL